MTETGGRVFLAQLHENFNRLISITSKSRTASLAKHFDVKREQLQPEEFVVSSASQAAGKIPNTITTRATPIIAYKQNTTTKLLP